MGSFGKPAPSIERGAAPLRLWKMAMEKPSMRKTRRSFLVVSMVVVGAILFLTGCASLPAPDDDGTDPLPWNAPAGWENSIIGVPF